jgi:hypothetical protein
MLPTSALLWTSVMAPVGGGGGGGGRELSQSRSRQVKGWGGNVTM